MHRQIGRERLLPMFHVPIPAGQRTDRIWRGWLHKRWAGARANTGHLFGGRRATDTPSPRRHSQEYARS